MANTASRRLGWAFPALELLGLTVLAGVALITAVGCVLGAVYEYTDNLAVPVVTHATYNVTLLLVSYLAL